MEKPWWGSGEIKLDGLKKWRPRYLGKNVSSTSEKMCVQCAFKMTVNSLRNQLLRILRALSTNKNIELLLSPLSSFASFLYCLYSLFFQIFIKTAVARQLFKQTNKLSLQILGKVGDIISLTRTNSWRVQVSIILLINSIASFFRVKCRKNKRHRSKCFKCHNHIIKISSIFLEKYTGVKLSITLTGWFSLNGSWTHWAISLQIRCN